MAGAETLYKLKIHKKNDWPIYFAFLVLLYSCYYYIQNYGFRKNVETLKIAVIVWPIVVIFGLLIYLSKYYRKDRLLDTSAVLMIIFAIETLIVFDGNVINLVTDLVYNVLWFSLIIVFYFHAIRYGVENKYLYAALVGVILLSSVFVVLVENTKSEVSLKTLNPIYYILYLAPYILLISQKIPKYIGLGFIFFAIFISNKRTALIAFFLVMLFFVVQAYRETSNGSLDFIKNLAKTLGIAGGLFLVCNIALSYYDVIDWSKRLGTLVETGGAGRVDRWIQFWTDMKQSSVIELIFGHGFVYPFYHNDLLQLFYNCGIPGFIVYIYLCVLLVKRFFQMLKKKYKYTTAFGASLIIFFFNSMVGQVIVLHSWFLEMAVLWGIILGDFQRHTNEQ